MDTILNYYRSFQEYETNFDGMDAIEWTKNHTEIPIYFLSLYLIVVFYVPGVMGEKAYKMRHRFALWNLLLCSFSIIGCYKTLPTLLTGIHEHGLVYSMCTDPKDWYLQGASGLWTTLFVFSKIPELYSGNNACAYESFLVVVQKKPVIFLHWFHHTTVLLYCWHSFAMRSANGLWFTSMNYTVHSIMYGYYFFSISGLKSIARPLAPLITSMQLLQMVVGCSVTLNSAIVHSAEGSDACFVDPANYKMGLGMYFSYMVLFGMLFYNLYLKEGARYAFKGEKKDSNTDTGDQSEKVCGVDVSSIKDSAGFFHNEEKPKGKKNVKRD